MQVYESYRVGVNGTNQVPAVRIVVDGPFADSLKVIFSICLMFRIVVSKAHKILIRRKIHEDGCIPVFHTGVLPVQQVRVESASRTVVARVPYNVAVKTRSTIRIDTEIMIAVIGVQGCTPISVISYPPQ